MMTNDDVTDDSNELLKINQLYINENMAYATHSKFTYKGLLNDDVVVLTLILEKTEGRWYIAFGQRPTGSLQTHLHYFQRVCCKK